MQCRMWDLILDELGIFNGDTAFTSFGNKVPNMRSLKE